MPSTMAPTKAMARYAVITLSLPANVMRSLRCRAALREKFMVNRKSLGEKVSLAAARHSHAFRVHGPAWLRKAEIDTLKSL